MIQHIQRENIIKLYKLTFQTGFTEVSRNNKHTPTLKEKKITSRLYKMTQRQPKKVYFKTLYS